MACSSIIVPAFVQRYDSSFNGEVQLMQTQKVNVEKLTQNNNEQNLKQSKIQLQSRSPMSVRSSPVPVTDCSILDSAIQFLERRRSHESTINRRHSQYSKTFLKI